MAIKVDAAGETRHPTQMKSKRKMLLYVVAVVGPFILFVPIVLRLFVFEAFKMPSGSMLPTLEVGDQIFAAKTDDEPQRGWVMVFECPEPPYEDYVKRVIALGGDEVMVRGGVVTVNGVELEREFVEKRTVQDRDARTERWHPFDVSVYREKNGGREYFVAQELDAAAAAPDFGPVKIAEGTAFFMGDNRDHSYDSRAWGPVPYDSIIGRTTMIWFSSGPDGTRSERIFTEVN